MRFGDEESVVATFFDMAKKYCQWAEAPAEPGDALRALRLVASLYDVALVLPETSPGDASQSEERTKIETGAIYERFQQLPFRYYHDTFDPLADPPEEPITGDIADDLRDELLVTHIPEDAFHSLPGDGSLAIATLRLVDPTGVGSRGALPRAATPVQDDRCVASADQLVDDRGPDEAVASGDHHPHGHPPHQL